MRLMKRIEAIIRSEKMQDVKQGLIDSGHAELTLYQVQSHGTGRGITRQWRGRQYSVDVLAEVAVVVMADDQEVPAIVRVIRKSARTDRVGDGKIFVTPVDEVIPV